MSQQLRIIPIGNSLGVILPKPLLARLQVGKGDAVFAIESENGIELCTYEPGFAQAVEMGEALLEQERALLRELGEDA